MNKLEEFIENIVSSMEDGDLRFDLLRWSKEEPYWCVFACEHGDNTQTNTNIKGVTNIGGHYCIGREENLHGVLSLLADSGWKVEIHQDYWN